VHDSSEKKRLNSRDLKSLSYFLENGAPGRNGVPLAWNEYQLCKEFGWTPSQLDNQDSSKIKQFIQISNVMARVQSKNLKKKK